MDASKRIIKELKTEQNKSIQSSIRKMPTMLKLRILKIVDGPDI
jgi:hypothetical protein